MWITIINVDNDDLLKRLENYTGPIPQVGQTLTFLSGEGVFEVVDIKWETTKDDFYTFICEIHVRPVVSTT